MTDRRTLLRPLLAALAATLFLVACEFDAPIKEPRFQITVRVEGEFVPGSPTADIDADPVPIPLTETAPGSGVFISEVFAYNTPYGIDDPAVLLVAAERAADTDAFTLTVIQTDLHTTPQVARILYQQTLGPSDNPTMELNAVVPFPQ